MVAGEKALDLIDREFLANPQAAEGDVRHAITALRFYRQYGRNISSDRQRRALRHLLARPEFAATVIAELSRWQDWDACEAVTCLFSHPNFSNPAIDRAILGYLRAMPGDKSIKVLARLRDLAPERVADAEKSLSAQGSLRQEQ
jgi:hypothetical protein